MTLNDLAEILGRRRPIAVYRRRAGGRELVAAGRLERQEHGVLLVSDEQQRLHRVHLHPDLEIVGGGRRGAPLAL